MGAAWKPFLGPLGSGVCGVHGDPPFQALLSGQSLSQCPSPEAIKRRFRINLIPQFNKHCDSVYARHFARSQEYRTERNQKVLPYSERQTTENSNTLW